VSVLSDPPAHRCNPAAKNAFLSPRLAAKLLLSLALIGLFGCAASTFRNDVRGYTEAYAQVSDKQMLYNLARLNNGLAPYFLTIGQIQSSFQMQASDQATVGATGQIASTVGPNTDTHYFPGSTGVLPFITTAFTRAVTRGLNLNNVMGGSVQSNPTFTYIPLNGDQAFRQFLTQVASEVFEHFCQQGWPIDQVVRVLVDRIEIRLPNGQLSVLTNSPTRGDPKSYVTFLRVCGELRDLQRMGKLVIRTRKSVQYFGDQVFENPASKDLISANAAGYKWYKIGPNAWMIGKETNTVFFTVLSDDIKGTLDDSSVAGSISQKNLLNLLKNGISISSDIPSMDEPSQSSGAYIVVRSVSTALSAAATEQNDFYDILKHYPPGSPTGIPADECRPVLELLWGKSAQTALGYDKLLPPLVSIPFAGKTYKVTDPVTDACYNCQVSHWADRAALSSWNRDTFRMLVELQSEIGVDLSKYQNQVIQFRQQ